MEPEEKKPDPKYGKKRYRLTVFSPPHHLVGCFFFLKTGEEMETMTAGGREGVDPHMALMQIRTHPNPRTVTARSLNLVCAFSLYLFLM